MCDTPLIHHSALSFRKLRAMKIKDRLSIHVVILNADLATPESLSCPLLFGQFGTIASIRILKDTTPREAHIRFSHEVSAGLAIQWCNNVSPMFVNAKFGYQKYCVKFVNNQACDIPGCSSRHAWADTRDILNFWSLTPQGIDPLSGLSSSKMENRYKEEKTQMMRNICLLQKQFVEQQKLVKMLSQKMMLVQRENNALKLETTRRVRMQQMRMVQMKQMGFSLQQMAQMQNMANMQQPVSQLAAAQLQQQAQLAAQMQRQQQCQSPMQCQIPGQGVGAVQTVQSQYPFAVRTNSPCSSQEATSSGICSGSSSNSSP
jgi:hypothetical protein